MASLFDSASNGAESLLTPLVGVTAELNGRAIFGLYNDEREPASDVGLGGVNGDFTTVLIPNQVASQSPSPLMGNWLVRSGDPDVGANDGQSAVIADPSWGFLDITNLSDNTVQV